MKSTAIIVLFSLFLIGCESNLKKDLFLVQTGEVTKLDSTGAIFSALVVNEGSDAIIDHGFVWSIGTKYPLIGSDFIKSLGPDLNSNKFTVKIPREDLETDTIIHLRGYVRTSKNVSYGSDVTFSYPLFSETGSGEPVIKSLSPNPMTWYDTVTITGDNFSYINQEINVKIQEYGSYYFTVPALKSTKKTIKILLQYPVRIANPDIYVVVKGLESNHVTGNMGPPEITSISPASGKLVQMITIYGQNLGNNYVDSEVRFNGLLATIITPRILGSYRVWLPPSLTPGPASVTISFLGMGKVLSTTKPDFFTLTTK